MADDFSDKLSAILGNPEAMGQIMSIAQTIGGGNEESAQGEVSPPESAESSSPLAPMESSSPATQGPDLSSLLGMLGGLTGGGGGGQSTSAGGAGPLSALANLDPRIIQAGMKLLTEMNQTDDRKTALLAALRPFVKETRYAKMDRAIQIAKLSRIIRVAFTVFKEGGDHV